MPELRTLKAVAAFRERKDSNICAKGSFEEFFGKIASYSPADANTRTVEMHGVKIPENLYPAAMKALQLIGENTKYGFIDYGRCKTTFLRAIAAINPSSDALEEILVQASIFKKTDNLMGELGKLEHIAYNGMFFLSKRVPIEILKQITAFSSRIMDGMDVGESGFDKSDLLYHALAIQVSILKNGEQITVETLQSGASVILLISKMSVYRLTRPKDTGHDAIEVWLSNLSEAKVKSTEAISLLERVVDALPNFEKFDRLLYTLGSILPSSRTDFLEKVVLSNSEKLSTMSDGAFFELISTWITENSVKA